MSGEKDQSSASYLSADELCVGIFVMLDIPWFKHNFALSSFKVRSAEQVRELRALKLPRYRYDPARSEVQPEPGAAPAVIVREEEPAPAPVKPPSEPVDPVKARRTQEQAARRQAVERVEKSFGKATAVMKNLNKNLVARPKETLEEMGGLVRDMVSVFLVSPEATLHVMGDKVGGEDVYYHSLNVTILVMMLAKDLGFTTDSAVELGVGAMLHDLGLSNIPDRVLKKSPSEYTSAEQKLRASHVEMGVELGRKLGLSPQVLAIIAQHHELADGTGYPKGIKEAAMTPAARLVSLVNFYDNLCNPVDIAKAMTPHEALSFMFAQRRAKFEAGALQLMIRSLGVYPPGSIVQLSNEVLAAVTSINPKKPLRPNILIYDAKIPKEEAITLDLEQEPELNIAKSIRPALLPPKVAAYLNPRKRVTYFFDGSQEGGG